MSRTARTRPTSSASMPTATVEGSESRSGEEVARREIHSPLQWASGPRPGTGGSTRNSIRRGGRTVRRLIVLAALGTAALAGRVSGGDTRPASKADAPPRKVVVGTAIFSPSGSYFGLDAR